MALEQIGCVAEEFLLVGDSLMNDIKWYTDAGIGSVWLNRNGADKSACIEAQYDISSLVELLEVP